MNNLVFFLTPYDRYRTEVSHYAELTIIRVFFFRIPTHYSLNQGKIK